MKRFIATVLCATVISIGLGAIVREAGASLRSDEKALAIIQQARIALGGEQALGNVKAIVIKGKTSRTLDINGTSKTIDGETEIAMQLPDKFTKQIRLGDGPGGAAHGKTIKTEVSDVVIIKRGSVEGVESPEGKKIVVRSTGDPSKTIVLDNGENVAINGEDGEFTTADGKKIKVRVASRVDDGTAPANGRVIVRSGENGEVVEDRVFAVKAEPARNNEMLRTALSLLLTPPEGMEVSYKFIGEEMIDGETCSIIEAVFAGSSTKLYISNISRLPIQASFTGAAMTKVIAFDAKEGASGDGKNVFKATNIEDLGDMTQTIRFSDHRTVNGVQLPYKWVTSVNGKVTESYDVTSYEINPANIAERFSAPTHVKMIKAK